MEDHHEIAASARLLTAVCYQEAASRGWHTDPATGGPFKQTPERLAMKLALIHSEISETLEGVRKGKQDDHLPHRTAEEVELADAAIRIFDYAGSRGLDLGAAIVEKLAYNRSRADHKPEARAAAGGKKF